MPEMARTEFSGHTNGLQVDCARDIFLMGMAGSITVRLSVAELTRRYRTPSSIIHTCVSDAAPEQHVRRVW